MIIMIIVIITIIKNKVLDFVYLNEKFADMSDLLPIERAEIESLPSLS